MSSSRREFLRQSGVAGIGFWTTGGIARAEPKPPNERINIACIGVGGKGDTDTVHAGTFGNIVALCDIDDNALEKKAVQFPKAKKYNDFRKMFDDMSRSIDAVTVSTPDHTHALASLIAMSLGKHVYCQKPLAHTVYEARLMREAARKYKVATQMGNQGTAETGLRRAVEILQAGVIGDVREVHVWTNRPGQYWPQAPKVTRWPKPTVCPPRVHWDLFLGPAPMRPYAPGYHPFAWRGWWDFGSGALGDMACHTANLPFMALKLGHPTSVVAEAGDVNPETCPSFARITYEFPARAAMPALKLYWYEGKNDGNKVIPPDELLSRVLKPGQTLSDSGALLVGDKGLLFSPNDYGARHVLLPEEAFRGYQGPAPTLPRIGGGDLGMKEEWVKAIKGGRPALSNFDYAGMLTEAVQLGNVAIRAGKKLEWDGPALKVTNCPEAEQYLRTEYRKGWELPV